MNKRIQQQQQQKINGQKRIAYNIMSFNSSKNVLLFFVLFGEFWHRFGQLRSHTFDEKDLN